MLKRDRFNSSGHMQFIIILIKEGRDTTMHSKNFDKKKKKKKKNNKNRRLGRNNADRPELKTCGSITFSS